MIQQSETNQILHVKLREPRNTLQKKNPTNRSDLRIQIASFLKAQIERKKENFLSVHMGAFVTNRNEKNHLKMRVFPSEKM